MGTLGGVAAVAAWMLQALVRDYDVTLLCWRPPELDAMNRFFGTSVQARDLKTISVPALFRRIVELDPDPGSIQDWCVLLRRCKQLQHRFDLVLGTELEADYGVPGIQYIHWPGITSFYRPAESVSERRWWKRSAALVRGELRPWMLLADFSFDRMRQNLTLTSSDWVGDLVRQAYGIETLTVYPPAGGNFSRVPWARRQDAFVSVGRLSPNKRIEWIVETLSRVRARGRDIKLHVAGSLDDAPRSRAYRRKLVALIRSHADWVELHENLSREELLGLLARNRYGIHANTEEHFGIAVAEMLLAGCIPFVYHKGGPVEIVDHLPHLMCSSADDAAEKILRMMSDRPQQESTLEILAARAELFTAERFMRDVRALVRRELMKRSAKT
jgi:glycosyltransferase involved in cell wall biosynthesis